MRFYITLFILNSFISCDYIASKKNDDSMQLDTVIDFTKVDTSPYFKKCKNEIDEKRTKCFEEILWAKVTTIFKNYSNNISDEFDEEIMIFLKISKKGNISVDSIQKSNDFNSLVPGFDRYIKKRIQKFPKVYPALKRGIPVVVQYKLPIHIISN